MNSTTDSRTLTEVRATMRLPGAGRRGSRQAAAVVGATLTLTLVLLTAMAGCNRSQRVEQPRSPSEAHDGIVQSEAVRDVMVAKMAHADGVLRGITMGDFALVEEHARELAFLSRLAEWQVHDTPEYVRYSMQFRDAAEALVAAAEARNMATAEADYARMTRACMICHAYLRQQGLLDLPTRTSAATDRF